jgi:hypothetical protein
MTSMRKRPIPDGRMRIIKLLNEDQKQALRSLRPEGLLILNFYETETTQPETWVEYWFDSEQITEDELRALINKIITSS